MQEKSSLEKKMRLAKNPLQNDILLHLDDNEIDSDTDNENSMFDELNNLKDINNLNRAKREENRLKRLKIIDNGMSGIISHNKINRMISINENSQNGGQLSKYRHRNVQRNTAEKKRYNILGLQSVLDDEIKRANSNKTSASRKDVKQQNKRLKRLLNQLIKIRNLKRQIILPNTESHVKVSNAESELSSKLPHFLHFLANAAGSSSTTEKAVGPSAFLFTPTTTSPLSSTAILYSLDKSSTKATTETASTKSNAVTATESSASTKITKKDNKRFVFGDYTQASFIQVSYILENNSNVKPLEAYPTFSDPYLHNALSPIQAPVVHRPVQIMNKHIQVIDGNVPQTSSEENMRASTNKQPEIEGLVPFQTTGFGEGEINPDPVLSKEEAEKLMAVDLAFHERNEPETNDDTSDPSYIDILLKYPLLQPDYNVLSKLNRNNNHIASASGGNGNSFYKKLIDAARSQDEGTKLKQGNRYQGDNYYDNAMDDEQEKTAEDLKTYDDENNVEAFRRRKLLNINENDTILEEIKHSTNNTIEEINLTTEIVTEEVLKNKIRVKRDVDISDETIQGNYDEIDNVIKSKYVAGLDYENGDGAPMNTREKHGVNNLDKLSSSVDNQHDSPTRKTSQMQTRKPFLPSTKKLIPMNKNNKFVDNEPGNSKKKIDADRDNSDEHKNKADSDETKSNYTGCLG